MPSSPLIHPVPVPVSFCCVCLSIHRAPIFSYRLYHVRPCRTIVLLWVWLRLYQNTLLLMLRLYPIDIIIITVRIVYFRHSRSQSRVSIPVNIGQISLYASSSVLAPSHSCLPPSSSCGGYIVTVIVVISHTYFRLHNWSYSLLLVVILLLILSNITLLCSVLRSSGTPATIYHLP